MRILIAEDDPVSRRLLESYLGKWGYEVAAAGDGAEAWRLFEAGSFAMVVTDWMMPELDGPGLIRRIRASHQPGYVYTVMLTARSRKEDLVEGLEAGADDFLTKPFDRDELRARLRAGERILRLEHQLREAQAARLQAEQLAGLGRLAAGVAHEINNPIAFVTNNLAVLRRDVGSVLTVLARYESGREALARSDPSLVAEIERLEDEADLAYFRENYERIFERTAEGLQRIRRIVQDLRDFARLDEAESKEVDLNVAVRSAIAALGHELGARSIRVETTPGEVPPVVCHPAKINQVFYNVLHNAMQATAPGGSIEVRTRAEGNHAEAGTVVVEVEDHGVGIAPEHLPHLFEPFFTTRPVGSGTGLGLSVAYGILRDHGGTIEVESTLGRGSVFRIRIPARGG
ncbi:MAG: sensor histidine kinase [Isosphaeraceae bacterium]